jgi:hypothetical protein
VVRTEFVKVVVQAVALERDDDGNIIGEQLSEAVALYTPEQIAQYVENLRASFNAPANGGVVVPTREIVAP